MEGGVSRREFLKLSACTAGIVAGSGLASGRAYGKRLKPPVEIPDERITKEDYLVLKELAEKVYEGNRVKMGDYVFHMPSHGSYPSLFAWDSGWHTITMSRIEPGLAESELEFLVNQQMPDGRVPHEVVFKEIGAKESLWTKFGRSLSKNQFDSKMRSVMMDPPSFMVSAEKIFGITKNYDWLNRVLPRLERCAEYLTKTRDLFGDGLVAIVHPWESGTDSSSAYDASLGLKFNTALGAVQRGLGYAQRFDRFKELDYDLKKIAEDNWFVFEDLTVNSITIRGLISIARLNQALGNDERAKTYQAQAKKMISAIDRINWVEEEGCYFSRYDFKEPRLAMRTTSASLLPIFTGLVSKERAGRVIEEHLLNEKEFWGAYLVPFNAKDELEKEKIALEDLLLWRGHCIWININWMLNEGLLEYGYKDEARELTRRTAKLIKAEGFREFYDYRNGEGKRAKNFNWPGLVLDMIHRSWPELGA